jgi:hypothetical protein
MEPPDFVPIGLCGSSALFFVVFGATQREVSLSTDLKLSSTRNGPLSDCKERYT